MIYSGNIYFDSFIYRGKAALLFNRKDESNYMAVEFNGAKKKKC
jgi:hypothetical protein